MRNSVIATLTDRARKDPRVFLVTGDAGFGVLDAFQKEFPSRFLNLGVAEQNMIGFSAGLALSGFRPVVYNIAPFVLFRCYEQVRNDVCYQELPVTLVGIGSGLTYSPQGVTHYAVEDVALARTLPNLTILSPADPLEAAAAMEFAMDGEAPAYIRVAKSGEPVLHRKHSLDLSRPLVLREGEKVALLFHGSVGIEAVQAAERVSVPVRVLSLPLLQPLPKEALKEELAGIRTVITVEEHYRTGGLGSAISDWVVEEGLPLKVVKAGVSHEFVHVVKNNQGMREHYGFSAARLAEAVESAWNEG